MAESFKFLTQVQKDNKSFTDKSEVWQLRHFPDLKRWLRDRFVTGINRCHEKETQ